MRLKVLLPNEVFMDEEVGKIIAEAENGSFCLKPRHVDFVAAIVPGVFSFISEQSEEVFLAVDEGTLVKCGEQVWLSTRNAVRGKKLEKLKQAVEERYLNLDKAERIARSALARLEAGIVRQYATMRDKGL